MPDVGILNLQIHDDSAKAAEGLSKLVAKLEEMKNATSKIRLGTVASGLKKINEALAKIDTSTVDKLNAITNALEKLSNAAGNVGGIKISFGGGKSQNLETLASQAQAARAAATQATSGFEELKSSVQEISAQDTAIARSTEDIQKANEQLDFSKFDPSKLPLNALGMQISDNAKEMYKWGNAAKDSFESVQQMKSSELLNGFKETEAAMKASNSTMQDIGASTNEAAEGFENISSGIQEISELDRTMKDVSTNIDSVGQSAQEAAPKFERLDDAIEFAREWNASSGASKNEGADIESAKRYLEEFNAIENTNERMELLTTKIGLAMTKYDKEMSKRTPNESTLNGLALQINGLIRQIDTLNGKSVNLDVAKDITPEGLDELSKIDRLILKREELIRTLHEEMEANKLSIPQMMTRQNQIDELTEKIERLREKEEEEHTARLSVRETNEMAQRIGQIDLLIEKSEEAKAAYNALINDPNATNGERLAAALKINKAELDIKQYNELQGLLAKVSPEVQKFAKEQLDAGVSASTLKNKLFDLDGELKQKKDDLRDAADETKSLKQSFSELMFGAEGLGGSMKRMFPAISGLLSRFKQLVKYRMLRAVIKQISEGFREGYENYYQYSQAIGSNFAPAMDSAASALLQMKNSIGAAVAPLLVSLVPVLQTIVNWFISLINYVNQFIALLRGQKQWSRALPQTTKALDTQTKKAKAASKAMKDLLADWDELNIIQSQSGGGGGTPDTVVNVDYGSMFEEVREYDNWIKDLAEGIKEQFGSIWDFVKKIGIALLGWKLSNAFAGLLGTLGALVAAGALIDLQFNISEMLNNNYLKTGDAGWLIADALATLIGGVLMKKVLSKVLGGGAAKIAIPLTLAVTAIAGVKALLGNTDVTALSKEALVDSAYNALKVGGIGAYLLHYTGYNIGTAIGGGAGLAITTMGVIVGLKAIADTINTGEITKDTIKADLLSAGLVAGGLMLGEAMLGGTIATILTAGGIGAIATLGALFAVQAIIHFSDKDPIVWGKEKLTSEQIEEFVNQDLFAVDVPTTVKVISDTVDTTGVKRNQIEQDLIKTLGSFKVIQLGVAKGQDYENLENDVNTLIADIGGYINQAKEAGKLTIQYTPTLVGDGTTDVSEWYGSYTTGWDKVNEFAKDKGKQIGELLSKAEKGALVDGEPELLATLMGQLSRLSEAMTKAKTNADAFGALQLSLGDLSQASFDDIVTKFTEYKNNLKEQYSALVNEQYALQGELVAALFVTAGEDSPEYKKALAQYQYMGQHLIDSVNTSVEQAAKPGVDWLTDFLLKKYESVIPNLAARWDLGGDFNPLTDMFTGDEAADKAAAEIQQWLKNAISDSVHADLGGYIGALGLSAYQFIGDGAQEMLKAYLTETFGPEKTKEILDQLTPKDPVTIEVPVDATPVPKTSQIDHETIINETPKIVLADTTESYDFDAEGGVVDVPVEFSISAEEQQALRDAIESAMSDGVMDISEEMDLMVRYGWSNYENMLKELQYNLDEEGRNRGMMNRPIGTIASAGVSDVGSGRSDLYRPVVTPEPEDDQRQVNNTASGVERGVGNLYDALQSILRVAEAINRKEFKVSVVPDSSWGGHNARSQEAYDRVRG